MPYDQICLRILISGICIFHLKMRVFWLSGPNGSPDKKLKHEGNVAHRTFRGGCVLHLVLKNDSLYPKIAMFSYKWVTLYIKACILRSLNGVMAIYRTLTKRFVLAFGVVKSRLCAKYRPYCTILFRIYLTNKVD